MKQRLFRRSAFKVQFACSALYEEVREVQVLDEESEGAETIFLVPMEVSNVYVCAECGSDLTEIPYYNRFYCGVCGLHY